MLTGKKRLFRFPLNNEGVVRIQEKIFLIVEIFPLAHNRFELVFDQLTEHRRLSYLLFGDLPLGSRLLEADYFRAS